MHGVDRTTGTLVWAQPITRNGSRQGWRSPINEPLDWRRPGVAPSAFPALTSHQLPRPHFEDRFRTAAHVASGTIFVGGYDGFVRDPCGRSSPWYGDTPYLPSLSSELQPAGIVAAFEVRTGRPRWCQPWPAPVTGLLATAGGLVIVVSSDGQFAALSEESGEVLYQFLVTDGGNLRGPIAFAVEDRQYIAVAFAGREEVYWPGSTTRPHRSPSRTVVVFGL